MTTIAAMEPMLPDDDKGLEELATDLVAKARGLATRLHPVLRASVGDLVRSMNCYYSTTRGSMGEGSDPLRISWASAEALKKRGA
jgi:hypothetical protein